MYRFTYNGFTARCLNKHPIQLVDDRLTFAADFLVTGTSDSDFNTNLQTAYAALTDNNQAFTLQLGTDPTWETILSWSHSANTGFLLRPSLKKSETPMQTGRSQVLRFELTGEREPQQSGRSGRREAEIEVNQANPDTLRTLKFRGTWTALASGPTSATAAYAANVQAWVDTWLAALLTATGTRFWQRKGEPVVRWEDENKVLRFEVNYVEVKFSSTPKQSGSDVTSTTQKAIWTQGRFTRQDPATLGGNILGTAPPWNATASKEDRSTSPQPAKRGPDLVPRRYLVDVMTFYNDIANMGPTTLNAYWENTVRPWIKANLSAMFSHAISNHIIFESHSEPMEDVNAKSIACQAVVVVAASHMLLKYEEVIKRRNDRRLNAENIWNGIPDQYDLNEGGRRLELQQEVTQTRLDSDPAEPPYLASPWEFLDEDHTRSIDIIDPVTEVTVARKFTHTRRYLYAPEVAQSAAPPQPGKVITQDKSSSKDDLLKGKGAVGAVDSKGGGPVEGF